MSRTVTAAVLIALSVSLSLAASPEEQEIGALKDKVEALEKKTEDLQRQVREEHTPLLKDIGERLSTMEVGLDMVDYRTARIKALAEKVEALRLGGDLSLFLQGIGRNSQGLKKAVEVSYSGDIFITAPVGAYGKSVFFRGDIGQGRGIVPSLPKAFSGPNADLEFDEARIDLVEAWYTTSIPYPDVRDPRIDVTVGKMDPTVMFDNNAVANSETTQFFSNAFVNNLALEFGGDDNGYGAGGAVQYRFTSIYDKSLKVVGKAGVFEGNGNFRNALDNPFVIGEIDVWRPYYGLNGNYRTYLWLNETRHTELRHPNRDSRPNWGLGMSLDQQVTSDVTVFGRYGFQDGDVSEFDHVITAGAQILGNRWKRASDVIGLAYGVSHVSNAFAETSLSLEGYKVGSPFEHYAEAYYRYWIARQLSVSPDAQYVADPGGDGKKRGIFIYGARLQAQF